MTNGLALIVLTLGLCGATAALAQDPPNPSGPVRHRHATRATAERSPDLPAAGPAWDRLVKGSPDQQAAERRDNDLAGIKPIDHRKDDFFSDWRGLR